MTYIQLTSEEFVKSLTPISDNLQSKYLISAIREAQDNTLRWILGDMLLDKLQRLVADDEIRLPENADYKALIDQCQYVLAYQAVANCLVKTAYKIGNIGVAKASDENLQPVTWSELTSVRDDYQKKADSYVANLQRYLLNNRALFPELSECQCNIISAHLNSSASCGLVLGGARGKIEPRRITRKYIRR